MRPLTQLFERERLAGTSSILLTLFITGFSFLKPPTMKLTLSQLNLISKSGAAASLLLREALLDEANDTAQQITHTINRIQSTV